MDEIKLFSMRNANKEKHMKASVQQHCILLMLQVCFMAGGLEALVKKN